MGPQLVRCGMRRPHGAGRGGQPRFNGAATCSLRNGRSTRYFAAVGRCCFNGAATCSLRNAGPAVNTWGAQSRFNGAATCSLRNARGRLRACRCIPCFNGAATCSLRNVLPDILPKLYLPPLQWGRNLFVAEWPDCVLASPPFVRFNGAATCSLRNARTRPPAAPAPGSFNGAATCSLRNVSDGRRPRHTRACFNGAATCSLRNDGADGGEILHV